MFNLALIYTDKCFKSKFTK